MIPTKQKPVSINSTEVLASNLGGIILTSNFLQIIIEPIEYDVVNIESLFKDFNVSVVDLELVITFI